MGRWSKKHMVEFAKFAKNWHTPRDVERAYQMYLDGYRLGGRKGIINIYDDVEEE